MATFFANELAITADVPPRPPGDAALGGRKRTHRATIALDAPKLNSSSNGAQVTTSDTIVLFKIPPGRRFGGGRIVSSVSLGTATVAIGTAADTGKYRAAATFTAVDTPTPFGKAAAYAADELKGEETVILTVANASLPNTAGARLVVDFDTLGP